MFYTFPSNPATGRCRERNLSHGWRMRQCVQQKLPVAVFVGSSGCVKHKPTTLEHLENLMSVTRQNFLLVPTRHPIHHLRPFWPHNPEKAPGTPPKPFTRVNPHNNYAISSAIFIILVKQFCLSSAEVTSVETKLSEIVKRQAACLPVTLALWNKAKLSISTHRHPLSSRSFSQYAGLASLGCL